MADLSHIDEEENKRRMLAGELFYAFTPQQIQGRYRCVEAMNRFNDSRATSRRERVRLWRDLVQDARPMPPPLDDAQADEEQFQATDGWVDPPVFCDNGFNVKLSPLAYLNRNAHFIDSCPISIGARTLIGPSVHFYSGGHPLDPAVRNGVQGPEFGGAIVIEEDCWIGGHVTILPNVRVGRGATVGAGSVVTKDVPPFHLVVGVPARVVRKIDSAWDPQRGAPASASAPSVPQAQAAVSGPEAVLAEEAAALERAGQGRGEGRPGL